MDLINHHMKHYISIANQHNWLSFEIENYMPNQLTKAERKLKHELVSKVPDAPREFNYWSGFPIKARIVCIPTRAFVFPNCSQSTKNFLLRHLRTCVNSQLVGQGCIISHDHCIYGWKASVSSSH